MADEAVREQVRLYFYKEEHRHVLKGLSGRDRANLFRMLLASALRSGELRSLLDQLGYDSEKLLAGTSAPPRGAIQVALAAVPSSIASAPALTVAPSPVQAPAPTQIPAAVTVDSTSRVDVPGPNAAPIAAPEEPPLLQKVPPKLKLTGFFGEKPRSIRNNP